MYPSAPYLFFLLVQCQTILLVNGEAGAKLEGGMGGVAPPKI
jgi:hypothetical protein